MMSVYLLIHEVISGFVIFKSYVYKLMGIHVIWNFSEDLSTRGETTRQVFDIKLFIFSSLSGTVIHAMIKF